LIKCLHAQTGPPLHFSNYLIKRRIELTAVVGHLAERARKGRFGKSRGS
jgi:hypothetical protein